MGVTDQYTPDWQRCMSKVDRQTEWARLVWRIPVRHHRGDVTSNVGMKVNLFLPHSPQLGKSVDPDASV